VLSRTSISSSLDDDSGRVAVCAPPRVVTLMLDDLLFALDFPFSLLMGPKSKSPICLVSVHSLSSRRYSAMSAIISSSSVSPPWMLVSVKALLAG
jgi:hypothetical protein